mgnify:CR=1 FL=1
MADPIGWSKAHGKNVHDLLDVHGALLIRGLGALAPSAFKAVFEVVANRSLPYDHRVTERTEVGENNVYTSTDHPATHDLPMHHELSFHRHIAEHIAFYCLTPSREHGSTPLSDGYQLYGTIPEEVRRAFEMRDLLYVRNTGSPITTSWQQTFQTDDRTDVEKYCDLHGMQYRWKDNGELQTLDRKPSTLRHPRSGRRIWCNHTHLLHLHTYPPELVRRLFSGCAPMDLPHNVFFGDGHAIPDEFVDAIGTAYVASAHRFVWQACDLLLIDNLRVAHGRDRYDGERLLHVVMGGLFDRMSPA